MKLVNIFCGQNAEFLNVKAGGAYICHCAEETIRPVASYDIQVRSCGKQYAVLSPQRYYYYYYYYYYYSTLVK
jgi:hypothetical protein